jgi:glyoxylase-like metal-dependent hydrolase (beta-lactamase superfamily II)
MTARGVISSEELKKMLDANKVDVLLDLRSEEAFTSWRIEGREEFASLNIPQEEFVGEEERYLSRLPKGRNIVAVCAHGDSSKYAADLLRSHGISVVSLEGGMDAWSEFYEFHQVSADPEIYQILRVARGCLSYLIVSHGTAVVIDASRHLDRLQDLAASLNVRIDKVFDTHLHADHISGAQELATRSKAAYYLHPADAEGAALVYTPLTDGETFRVGTSFLEVVHSPGHTPGSTSFLLDKTYLFTGDTIMKNSIGRPDLGGKAEEWSRLLYNTLFRRYQGIGDTVIVLPSHAASVREQDTSGIIKTSMGLARNERELYQIRDEDAFAGHIRANLPQNPERYQEIRKANLGLQHPDETGQMELEIGKNLCGMSKQGDSRAA